MLIWIKRYMRRILFLEYGDIEGEIQDESEWREEQDELVGLEEDEDQDDPLWLEEQEEEEEEENIEDNENNEKKKI